MLDTKASFESKQNRFEKEIFYWDILSPNLAFQKLSLSSAHVKEKLVYRRSCTVD